MFRKLIARKTFWLALVAVGAEVAAAAGFSLPLEATAAVVLATVGAIFGVSFKMEKKDAQ